MKQNTASKLLDILNSRLELLGLVKEDIDINISLLEQGVLDSLSFLEYVTEIEKKFNIEFDFSELDPSEFNSITKLSNLINNGN